MDLTLLYFWLTKISLCNCQKLVIIKITYYAIVVNETLRDLNPNVSSVAPLSMCHHIEVWVVETIYLLLTLVITINWCIAINVFTISTDLMEHYLQGRWMIQRRPGKGGSSWCFCFCERTASSFWLFRQPQQAQSCFSCGLSLSMLNAPPSPHTSAACLCTQGAMMSTAFHRRFWSDVSHAMGSLRQPTPMRVPWIMHHDAPSINMPLRVLSKGKGRCLSLCRCELPFHFFGITPPHAVGSVLRQVLVVGREAKCRWLKKADWCLPSLTGGSNKGHRNLTWHSSHEVLIQWAALPTCTSLLTIFL